MDIMRVNQGHISEFPNGISIKGGDVRTDLASQSATFIVAASDSLHPGRADYVCNGVDDQVTIQAAIDALPGGGGQIILLEGVFYVTASIMIHKAGVIIRGQGRYEGVYGAGGTQIKATTGSSFQSFFDFDFGAKDFGSLQDMALVGLNTYQPLYGVYLSGAADDMLFKNIYIEYTKRNVYVAARVTNLYIINCFLEKSDYNIYISTSTACAGICIMDSVISSYKKSIFIENSQESVTIRSNTIIGNMYNAIYLKDTEDILITGNHLHGFSGVTNSPIHIENSDHIIINSNELYGNSGNEYGVTIDANGDYIGITENIFRDFVLGSVNVVSGANPHGRIYNQYSDLFMDIIVASTTAVHAAITGNGAEQEVITAITNPDVARNISITTTNVTSPSGDVTITGVDVKGNSTTEDITISAGGTSYGSKAFATVSKITIPAGVTTDDTVAIGISDKLGLSNIIYASGDVYKVKKNNADATVGTVNTTYGTVDCANITGGDDFTIYYKSNMNIIS